MKKTIIFLLLCLATAPLSAQTSVPKGYVDLGLSSGTLWKVKIEPNSLTVDEAKARFSDQIPSKEQLMELMYECDWQYSKKGITVVGPTGKKLFFSEEDYLVRDSDAFSNARLTQKGLYIPSKGWKVFVRLVDKTRVDIAHTDKEVDSDEYVDLGLLSGTLWKKHNEKGHFTPPFAIEKYGEHVPTREQMEELILSCHWSETSKGCTVIGPNGNSIYLPEEGECFNDESKPHSKFLMYYLTSTEGVERYSGFYGLKNFGWWPEIWILLDFSRYSLRLVSDGATHTGKIAPGLSKDVSLHRVESNGKYGYADEAGAVVIEPQYDVAMDFSEGLAYVATYQGDKCVHGFINEHGEMKIPLVDGKYDQSLKDGFSGKEYCFKNGFVRYPGDTVYLNQCYSISLKSCFNSNSKSKKSYRIEPSEGFYSIRKEGDVILANMRREDLVYAFDTTTYQPYHGGILNGGIDKAIWANGFGITSWETSYLPKHTLYCRKGILQKSFEFLTLLQREDSSMLCLTGKINYDDTYSYQLFDANGNRLAEGSEPCVEYLRKQKFREYKTPLTFRMSLLDRCQPRPEDLPNADFDFKKDDYVYVKFIEEDFGLNPSDFRCKKGSVAMHDTDSLRACATATVDYTNQDILAKDLNLALSEIPGYEGTDYALLYDLQDSTVRVISLPVHIIANGHNGMDGSRGENGSYGVGAECGGRGGNGGHGYNGGHAYNVHLRISGYFNSTLGRDRVLVDVKAGRGGAGGKGGEGGWHGMDSPCRKRGQQRAPNGYDGRRGRDGQPGSVDIVVTK